MLISLSIWKATQVNNEVKPKVEESKVISAHKYHGILFSECLGEKRYFYRAGKKCKLFTVSFENTWKRKVTNVKRTTNQKFSES